MPGHFAWERSDGRLIQIVDAGFAEAARRSGPWLACKLGCTDCCMGPFPITQLDALRLRAGLEELAARDPERAARVRQRARDAAGRMAGDFPGDLTTGVLDESEEAEERFATLAEDEPCPALDPATGGCDLYAARPITCRAFGPAMSQGGGALGACELCYQGASDAQIAACAVELDPDGVEDSLVEILTQTEGLRGQTIVAFALARVQ